ncbi:MAG: acetyltransferase [Bdellovibrionales bacterium]|nr:acetyltransferase [Bdellovibrionales bacterium]
MKDLRLRCNGLTKNIIFWGGTGQSVVNREILRLFSSNLLAIFDDTPEIKSPFSDVALFHGSTFDGWIAQQAKRSEIGFVVSIGNPHGKARLNIAKRLKKCGLRPVTLVHPTACIAKNVKIGECAQIMAGAIIQPNVILGHSCIVNTKSSVDHDCELQDSTEVGPGATLCGNVLLKEGAWVGAGATILPRIAIGKNSVIGGGALVTKDVPENSVYAGVPARPMITKLKPT